MYMFVGIKIITRLSCLMLNFAQKLQINCKSQLVLKWQVLHYVPVEEICSLSCCHCC